MKNYSFLMAILCTGFVCNAQHYFWADGKKNRLDLDSSILVLMNTTLKQATTSALTLTKYETFGECAVVRNVSKNDIEKLKKQKIDFAVGFRINSTPLIVTNVISFKANSDAAVVGKFSNRIRFRDRTATGVYHFTVSNFKETLKVANEVQESGLVEWCQPDFVIEIKVATNDPLFNSQYYLNNTGQTGGTNNIDINAPEAWGISKGCYASRVAVLDYGVEPHEDLGTRYVTGFTALDPNGAGLPASTQYHGQACAGIVAASHDNNLGIAGVSPNSLIIPVNGFMEVTQVSYAADAINLAWRADKGNADVLSNSWNWSAAPSLTEITQAITDARTQGRGGKGAIVVFATGNQGGGVEFPANVSGVIAVGAIDKSGQRWSYSGAGPEIDLVAPTGNAGTGSGDVNTLDLSDDPNDPNDDRGSGNGNYMSTFGGTSAAAPQVSGVAALLLSINPNLSEAQVVSILQSSATDMGSFGFDNYYGFGRVDAYKAIQTMLQIVAPSNPICTTYAFSLQYPLPPGTTVTWSTDISSGLSIDPSSGVATRMNNFNGQVNVTATFSGCFTGSQTTSTKKVRVGTYTHADYSIIETVTNGVHQYGLGSWMIGDATGYNWSWRNFTYVSGQGTRVVTLTPGPDHSGGYVGLSAQNACGWSDPAPMQFFPYRASFAMMASPNPASSTLTVQVVDSTTDNSSVQSQQPYQVYLYNRMKQTVYSTQSSDASVQIPLSNLPDDVYYLNVVYKDAVLQKQIVVKK